MHVYNKTRLRVSTHGYEVSAPQVAANINSWFQNKMDVEDEVILDALDEQDGEDEELDPRIHVRISTRLS